MSIQPLIFESEIIELEKKIEELKNISSLEDDSFEEEIDVLEKKLLRVKTNIYNSLDPSQKIMVARHPMRPYALDYIKLLFDDFIEFHGDRLYRDDPAIVCGVAKFVDTHVMVIGSQKGRNTKENIYRNFGMASPEGYRKALRMFYMAEKFKRPIITFVDTPGAYPGVGAEERGQAEAIAKNIREMAGLKVPVITIISGEGGSGGALGIAVGNRVLMLSHSVYSVISPEGCSSILWKSPEYSIKACESLKLTAQDVIKFGVIDEIIPEPVGGAHRNYAETADIVKIYIQKHLRELSALSPDELVEDRIGKYRKIGVFGS